MKKTLQIVIILIVLGALGFSWQANRRDGESGNIPTSADNAPPGSIHNLPVPAAVSAVRTFVANELGIAEGMVIVMSAYEKEWSDGCLGLGGPNESCLQALVPGYEVTVLAEGNTYTYRTDMSGSVIRAEKVLE